MNSRVSVRSVGLAATAIAVLAAGAAAGDLPGPKRSFVFAQNAHSFTLEGGTLLLDDVASTLYFSKKHFGQVTNAEFARLWSAAPDSFAETTPHAVLRVLAEGDSEVLLALSNPRVRGDDITYDATVLSGATSGSGACALFVDPSRVPRAPVAASAGKEPINRRDREARETIVRFLEKDPALERFFEESAGWAVFPTVAKGGLIVGGARGEGVVYKGDEVIGYSVLSQGSIGLQIGGQAYSEIIFFEDDAALNHFKSGNAEFSGQVSAVAVTAGASADASYAEGVAVFTVAKGGAMLEASIGGQGFSFEPR